MKAEFLDDGIIRLIAETEGETKRLSDLYNKKPEINGTSFGNSFPFSLSIRFEDKPFIALDNLVNKQTKEVLN